MVALRCSGPNYLLRITIYQLRIKQTSFDYYRISGASVKVSSSWRSGLLCMDSASRCGKLVVEEIGNKLIGLMAFRQAGLIPEAMR